MKNFFKSNFIKKIFPVKKVYIKLCILSAVIFLSAVLLLAGWKNKDTPLLTVDDMSVSEEEFLLFANNARALTAAWFYQEYGMDSSWPGFWNTRADDQTPAEYLLEAVLPQIIKAKTAQSEMAQCGIIGSADYNTFMQTYSETMSQRKLDTSAGKIVYGPLELSVMEFYSYYYGQCENQLREYYKTELLEFSEDDLRSYYEELKKTGLRPEVTGTVAFYDKLSDARCNSTAGETFILDSQSAGKEDQEMQDLITWVEKSEEGSIWGPIEYKGRSGYFVLKSREQKPFPEFEEVKDNLLWMYGDVVFEKELTEKYSQAKVSMNKPDLLHLIEESF